MSDSPCQCPFIDNPPCSYCATGKLVYDDRSTTSNVVEKYRKTTGLCEHGRSIKDTKGNPITCWECIGDRSCKVPLPKYNQADKFHELLKEIGDLHDVKQRDYGREGDPFSNVRAAGDWGTDAWVGAMIRATDKIRRLQKYAKTGTLSNEGARDSFMDLAVYSLIALLLWQEDNDTT